MSYTYVLTQSLHLDVEIFEAKVFFFADAVAHVFSGTYTYLLRKNFLKVLLFHQSSAKFAVEIKHDHSITLVEVLSASKTCTFS